MLNFNTTKITMVDEARECLSRQMMLTYSTYTSFKKFSKVDDVIFRANVFGQSVPCRRTSVRKAALAELGAKSW